MDVTHMPNDINYRDFPISSLLVYHSCPLGHKGPQLVKIDSGTVVLVSRQVEMAHTNFAKITWMAGERTE